LPALVLAVLIGFVAVFGCRGGGDDDAGSLSCAYADGGLYDWLLGLVPTDAGCGGCGFGVEGDPACVAAYPDLPAGCIAVCKDAWCERLCPGEHCWYPDGGACQVGSKSCRPSNDTLNICDRQCGASGGCRFCYFDEQCHEELGATAECERHCGTCCRQEDSYDGDYPCLCI
jgi:hypothetical protein